MCWRGASDKSTRWIILLECQLKSWIFPFFPSLFALLFDFLLLTRKTYCWIKPPNNASQIRWFCLVAFIVHASMFYGFYGFQALFPYFAFCKILCFGNRVDIASFFCPSCPIFSTFLLIEIMNHRHKWYNFPWASASLTWLLYNLQLDDVKGSDFINSLYAFGQSERDHEFKV